jgi:hypothetical protein
MPGKVDSTEEVLSALKSSADEAASTVVYSIARFDVLSVQSWRMPEH